MTKTYEITAPDGQTYEIDAPDTASQEEVLSYAQKNYGKAGGSPAPARTPRASAAPALDTRKTSQTLGAVKGGADELGNFWSRVGQIPGVGDYLKNPANTNASKGLLALPAIAYQGARAANRQIIQPKIAEAEKTYKAGGIGDFIGRTAVTLPAYAAGPWAGGALQGVAESKADPGDWAGVARDAAAGAAFGKLGDVVGGQVVKGVGGALAKSAAKKINPAKLVEELRTTKTKAYERVRGLGIQYAPQAVARLESELQTAMKAFRANAADHGPAFEFMKSVSDDIAEGRFDLEDVDKMRARVYRDVAHLSGDKAPTGMLGKELGKVVTDFMENTGAADIWAPNASALNQEGKLAIAAARKATKNFKNVERVSDLMRSSTLKTGSTYQGQNVDNRARQTLRPLIDPTSGQNIEHFLSPEEGKLLEKTVLGTPGHNALRAYGATSFLGGGLKALGNAGAAFSAAAAGGPIGAKLAALHIGASAASKLTADKITKTRVKNLIELMAAGGTKKAMLAERELRTLAAKKKFGASWLKTILDDIAEVATTAGVREQAETRQ